MRYNIYAMWDSAAEQYSSLFEAVTDAVALREYDRARKQSDFPDDYSLYCLGTWDRRPESLEQVGIVTQFRCLAAGETEPDYDKHQFDLEGEMANG